MKKRALITGITGMDGSYLAEFLLHKGYEIHGIIRRSSSFNTGRIDHIFNKIYLHFGDMTDSSSITNLVQKIKPDEIYNLAAQSHVAVSFDIPEYTTTNIILGNLAMLEAIQHSSKSIRFYQASSSEMFGNADAPQNEQTPFNPQSPYGVAKMAAYYNTINYRIGYSLFACNGILFNHTSPRRGMTFVTRKITNFLAKYMLGKANSISFGNLNSVRDIGFAPDYVQVMWKMLQGNTPNDYVVGTGKAISIKDILNIAIDYCGIDIRLSIVHNPGIILQDAKYFRPTEVNLLQANSDKVKQNLWWKPTLNIEEIIKVLIDYDLIKEGGKPIGEGIQLIKNQGYDWTTMI